MNVPTAMFNFVDGSVLGVLTALLLLIGAGRTYWVKTAGDEAQRQGRRVVAHERKLWRVTVAKSAFQVVTALAIGWPSVYCLWMLDDIIYNTAAISGLQIWPAIGGFAGSLMMIGYSIHVHKPAALAYSLLTLCGATAGMAFALQLFYFSDGWALIGSFAWIGAGSIMLLVLAMVVRGRVKEMLENRDARAEKFGADRASLADDKRSVI